ncbi:MAG: amidase family protein [Nocardioidaceae bacterium]
MEALIGFSRQLDALRRAGHEVIDVPFADLLGPYAELLAHNLTVNRYELAGTHAKWFDEHREHYRPETVAGIELGRSISGSVYAEAHDHLDRLRAGLDDRFAAAGVDLLVAPSALGAAPVGIDSTGDPAMAMPWTYAGVPAVSLPGATTAVGLPLGFQLIAPAGSDEALLAAAATLEPVLGP